MPGKRPNRNNLHFTGNAQNRFSPKIPNQSRPVTIHQEITNDPEMTILFRDLNLPDLGTNKRSPVHRLNKCWNSEHIKRRTPEECARSDSTKFRVTVKPQCLNVSVGKRLQAKFLDLAQEMHVGRTPEISNHAISLCGNQELSRNSEMAVSFSDLNVSNSRHEKRRAID
jgi:hypothetical protein